MVLLEYLPLMATSSEAGKVNLVCDSREQMDLQKFVWDKVMGRNAPMAIESD
jgi:hypothetical protein